MFEATVSDVSSSRAVALKVVLDGSDRDFCSVPGQGARNFALLKSLSLMMSKFLKPVRHLRYQVFDFSSSDTATRADGGNENVNMIVDEDEPIADGAAMNNDPAMIAVHVPEQ